MVGKNSIGFSVHTPWMGLGWVSCGIVMEGVSRICWRKRKKNPKRRLLYTSTDTELARQRREGQPRNK